MIELDGAGIDTDPLGDRLDRDVLSDGEPVAVDDATTGYRAGRPRVTDTMALLTGSNGGKPA